MQFCASCGPEIPQETLSACADLPHEIAAAAASLFASQHERELAVRSGLIDQRIAGLS